MDHFWHLRGVFPEILAFLVLAPLEYLPEEYGISGVALDEQSVGLLVSEW